MLLIPSIPLVHAASYDCSMANPPDPSKTTATPPTYILTILESNVGQSAPTTDAATKVLDCYRVNTTTPASADGATPAQTNATYAATCQGSDTVVCQKVQLLFAQSGAELIYVYVALIYRWASVTIGIVAVFFIVLGGIEMQMSQGDSGRIEKAKERITQSLGGLVLLFLSALILYTINPNFFTIS